MASRMNDHDRANLGCAPGSRVRGAACVRTKQERTTRKRRRPYLRVGLTNTTGEIAAFVWEESIPDWAGIAEGDPVRVIGRVDEGRNGYAPSLRVESVEKLPAPHPVQHELNGVCPIPIDELDGRLGGLIGMIDDPDCRRVVDAVMESVGRQTFLAAPAAKARHHAHSPGGLCLHSIEVAHVAMGIFEALDHLDSRPNLGILISGSLLHDIGKIEEYRWGPGTPVDFSPTGRLTYHTARGSEMIREAVRERHEMTDRLATVLRHLQHIALSHHGKPEHGSPVPPRTLESIAVHHADLVSARMAEASDAIADGTDDEGWAIPTAWNREPVWHYGALIGPPPHTQQELRTDVLLPHPHIQLMGDN